MKVGKEGVVNCGYQKDLFNWAIICVIKIESREVRDSCKHSASLIKKMKIENIKQLEWEFVFLSGNIKLLQSNEEMKTKYKLQFVIEKLTKTH